MPAKAQPHVSVPPKPATSFPATQTKAGPRKGYGRVSVAFSRWCQLRESNILRSDALVTVFLFGQVIISFVWLGAVRVMCVLVNETSTSHKHPWNSLPALLRQCCAHVFWRSDCGGSPGGKGWGVFFRLHAFKIYLNLGARRTMRCGSNQCENN